MPTLMQAPRDVIAALQKKLDDAECGVQYDLKLEDLSAEHKRMIKVAKDKEGRSEGSIRVAGPVTKFADASDLSKDGFLRRPEAVAKAILAMITSRGDEDEGAGAAAGAAAGARQQACHGEVATASVGGGACASAATAAAARSVQQPTYSGEYVQQRHGYQQQYNQQQEYDPQQQQQYHQYNQQQQYQHQQQQGEGKGLMRLYSPGREIETGSLPCGVNHQQQCAADYAGVNQQQQCTADFVAATATATTTGEYAATMWGTSSMAGGASQGGAMGYEDRAVERELQRMEQQRMAQHDRECFFLPPASLPPVHISPATLEAVHTPVGGGGMEWLTWAESAGCAGTPISDHELLQIAGGGPCPSPPPSAAPPAVAVAAAVSPPASGSPSSVGLPAAGAAAAGAVAAAAPAAAAAAAPPRAATTAAAAAPAQAAAPHMGLPPPPSPITMLDVMSPGGVRASLDFAMPPGARDALARDAFARDAVARDAFARDAFEAPDMAMANLSIHEFDHLSDQQLEELAWETSARLHAMHAALYMRDQQRRQREMARMACHDMLIMGGLPFAGGTKRSRLAGE